MTLSLTLFQVYCSNLKNIHNNINNNKKKTAKHRQNQQTIHITDIILDCASLKKKINENISILSDHAKDGKLLFFFF